MSLNAGTRIGSFEVIEPIGAGGMGEVYRARDTRLGRDVALKILPAAFASDPDRLARFEREARMLASLNHPHIAQIHGLEEAAPSGDTAMRALIMELVEGEDLAHRLARGPIPPREAIGIAAQIAEALDAAHEIGVIHRDLKPGNVRIREDGSVKLLDFGLAKPSDAGGALGNEILDNSPTISSPAITGRGVILGTAAYMAPEQAKGKVVDKRADVWALGVVLYEMLSGRRPFRGSDSTEVIAQILEREPDWSALPRSTPPHIVRLTRRCLEKDRRLRMRDCGDLMLELREPADGGSTPQASTKTMHLVIGAAVCVALGIAAALLAGAIRAPRSGEALPTPGRFAFISSIDPLSGRLPIAISRDGRRVVYSGNSQLLVRAVDELTPRPIPGTEPVAAPTGERGNTGFAVQPIVSFDGESVAYRQGTQLKRVPIAGGAPSVICTCFPDYGGTWSDDNTILFGLRQYGRNGVWRVSAGGGTPELVVPLEPELIALYPQLLPGHTHVLFTITHGAHWNQSAVVVQPLNGGERRVLIEGGMDGRYAASGHIVYGKDGVIYAVKFDPSSLRVSGDATPVLSGVAQQTSAGSWGGFALSLSDVGTVAYLPADSVALRRVLVWIDRNGREERLPAEPRAYQYPRLSPDGQRVALDMREQQNDVWSWDLVRGTLTPLTHERFAGGPAIWNRTGDAVVFAPDIDGVLNLHMQSTNGGSPQRLSTSPNGQAVDDLTPDGKWVVFTERDPKGGVNLRRLQLDGSSQPLDLLATTFNEANSDVSPDGRWIAYQSDESRRTEVYVRPFPEVNSGRTQVSPTGGSRPLWSRDGSELFFLDDNRRMNVVTVQHGSAISFGTPRVLFDTTSLGLEGVGRNFELSADGTRFLMVRNLPPRPELPAVVLIQNWFSEFPR